MKLDTSLELLVALTAFLIAVTIHLRAYRAGYEAHKRELAARWHAARCGECGAEPRPILLHVSGCRSGWPAGLPPGDEG
jgi:hypothetical protein